ncbi:MAG: hypothetical protein RL556_387 [Actinomycetota bacterium]|jgi:tight adherence protein B
MSGQLGFTAFAPLLLALVSGVAVFAIALFAKTMSRVLLAKRSALRISKFTSVGAGEALEAKSHQSSFVAAASAQIQKLWARLSSNILNQRKQAKFMQELPPVLHSLASSLRVGLNLNQAIESIATHNQSEVGVQFRIALAEVKIGSDLETSLSRVATRMNNNDLKWLVVAMQIQKQVGGSLTSVLESVATTITDRAEVRREVQVLSAEGRLSAYILVALPFLVLLALLVLRPEYVWFFFSSLTGLVLLAGFLMLMTIGWFWVKAATRVEV